LPGRPPLARGRRVEPDILTIQDGPATFYYTIFLTVVKGKTENSAKFLAGAFGWKAGEVLMNLL
jgi:hypothetical protein